MKQNSKLQQITIWAGLALSLMAGCSPPAPTAAPAKSATATPPAGTSTPEKTVAVTVFAAASLADVLKELKEDFAKEQGGKIDLNLAASAVLARQIEQGAPADLFYSASTEWGDFLAKKELVVRRSDRLENRLVLVVPKESTASLRELKDLTGAAVKHVALADIKSAPAGKYAKKALEAEKLWEQVQPKVVSGDDVRQALMFVERGEAEAALVYATDAAQSKKVRVVATIDEKLTGPIRYSLVLLKKGEKNSTAEAFYIFLTGPIAAQTFERHGFRVPKEQPK